MAENPQTDASHWLLKADVYRILAGLFAYPDQENLQATRTLIDEVLSTETLPAEIAVELKQWMEMISTRDLQPVYSHVFIQGGVPLSESAYNPSIDVYSELATYYQAFGMEPSPGDSPDTLPYELEFVGILCAKVALAKNDEQRQVARAAYQQFIASHLQPLVAPLVEKLEALGQGNVYVRLATFLKQWLTVELNGQTHVKV